MTPHEIIDRWFENESCTYYLKPFTYFIVDNVYGCDVNYIVKLTGETGRMQMRKADLKPIPLTPEILEKCGFEKDADPYNWANPDWDIYRIKRMSIGVKEGMFAWYNRSDDDFYSSYYPELKFLHQLQNLYFSLTGEELEVKL
jgi:hypothetical protein